MKMVPAQVEPIEYTLPAYWASYLINGDSSGLSAEEIAEANKFLASVNAYCVSCADEWSEGHNEFGFNDANNLRGETLVFEFIANKA